MQMSLSGGIRWFKKNRLVIIERSLKLRHMHREQFATNGKKSRQPGQERKKAHGTGPEQRGKKVTKGRELNICT